MKWKRERGASNAPPPATVEVPPVPETVRVVRAAIESLGRFEEKPMKRLLATECVWHIPGSSWIAGEHRGSYGWGEMLDRRRHADSGDDYEDSLVIVVDAAVGDATTVAAAVRYTGRAGPRADGDIHGCLVWRLDGDRAVEVREHVFEQDRFDAYYDAHPGQLGVARPSDLDYTER